MSEPRRRSTRLVGTPKVNYEEKPVELPSKPSSLRKRRDSPEGKYSDEENKRFKKAKLKHDDDDEDTILDDGFRPVSERKSTSGKSTNGKTKKKRRNRKASRVESEDEDATDLDETADSGQLYLLNESTEELKENHLNSQNTANDHPTSRQEASSQSVLPGHSTNREKAAVQRDPSGNLVDEHGFLVLDDEPDPPSSPLDNQQTNILDVTDYGLFNDDSTLAEQGDHRADNQGDRQTDHQDIRTESNDENRTATAPNENKRQPRKKFVKKHKRKSNIEPGNFVKYTDTVDSQATIIINRPSDEPDDASNSSSSKESSQASKPKSSQSKKPSKNFVDFFQSLPKSKPSSVEQQDDEVQVIQPVKRGRGRPRKNPPAQATIPPPSAAPIKQLPEIEPDCELVEIVTKPPAVKRDALLDSTNSNNARLSPIDDNTIIVLDKRDDAFIANRPDDPWTIKYRPVRADQVLDNQQASEKIKNWIQDFSKNVESRALYDSDDEDEEERFETCVLVTGPTGCGKTAMVYAIAEELNYKVFEINCSSRRNSRFINQIKEATLSHTVTRQSDSSSSQLFSSNSKGGSKASSKNPPPADGKQKTLFSFFQKKPAATATVQTPLIDESSFSQETVNNLKALSINSNSLILFDDVDVIFEEDGGFWQALSSLIEHTKRPIILTATDQIDNIRQEIRTGLRVRMNCPKRSALTDHLKSIVMSECYEPSDDSEVSLSPKHARQIEIISKENHRDIRGCLNRLQFDFSSVNVPSQAADPSAMESTIEASANELPVNEQSANEPSANEPSTSPSDRAPEPDDAQSNEPISLQAYQGLILSDLLSSSHFQTNSRNEFDSSCKYEETYQSQDLRESIRDECIQLSSLPTNDGDQFGRVAGGTKKAEEESHSNWLDSFERCAAEVEGCLVPVSVRSPLYCDYLPYLSSIMSSEQTRFQLFVEHTRRARRFLHYLDQNNFHLTDFVKLFLKDDYLAVKQV